MIGYTYLGNHYWLYASKLEVSEWQIRGGKLREVHNSKAKKKYEALCKEEGRIWERDIVPPRISYEMKGSTEALIRHLINLEKAYARKK